MRKRMKIAILLLTVMLVGVLPTRAKAHPVPDLEKNGSISVTMQDKGTPVAGGSLTLYYAGEIRDADGDFVFALTPEFAGSGASLENIKGEGLAAALAEYAGSASLTGKTQGIGSDGKTAFGDLAPGLYLVVQQEPAEGYYPVAPFLVSVPMYDGSDYQYDVDATPKVELNRAPETEPTKPSAWNGDDPGLPQTGQTVWLVPVLGMIGVVLILVGVALRSGKGRRDDA